MQIEGSSGMREVEVASVHWPFLAAYVVMFCIAGTAVIGGVRDLRFYSKNGWDFSLEREPANKFQRRLKERFSRLKIGQIRLLYYFSNLIMGGAWVIGAGHAAIRNILILMN